MCNGTMSSRYPSGCFHRGLSLCIVLHFLVVSQRLYSRCEPGKSFHGFGSLLMSRAGLPVTTLANRIGSLPQSPCELSGWLSPLTLAAKQLGTRSRANDTRALSPISRRLGIPRFAEKLPGTGNDLTVRLRHQPVAISSLVDWRTEAQSVGRGVRNAGSPNVCFHKCPYILASVLLRMKILHYTLVQRQRRDFVTGKI